MSIKFSIIFFLIILFSCTSNKNKSAKILFNKTSVAFDTVKVGQTKSEGLTLKNVGTDTLYIEKFNCSCECTVPQLKDSTKISPSDSIKIQLSVKGFADDKGKWKNVLCTFKTNADSIFSRIKVIYFTK